MIFRINFVIWPGRFESHWLGADDLRFFDRLGGDRLRSDWLEDGGLGLPPKSVQERLGHSGIALTMDTYSHLFPSTDNAGEMALAEAALLA